MDSSSPAEMSDSLEDLPAHLNPRLNQRFGRTPPTPEWRRPSQETDEDEDKSDSPFT